MNSLTEIGKALRRGATLAGAAAAGNSEARYMIERLSEAEREKARRAACGVPPENGDSDFFERRSYERQFCQVANDIERAIARCDETREPPQKGGGVRHSGYCRYYPPGTRANRRRGRRA